jgi:hypothetical protein
LKLSRRKHNLFDSISNFLHKIYWTISNLFYFIPTRHHSSEPHIAKSVHFNPTVFIGTAADIAVQEFSVREVQQKVGSFEGFILSL